MPPPHDHRSVLLPKYFVYTHQQGNCCRYIPNRGGGVLNGKGMRARQARTGPMMSCVLCLSRKAASLCGKSA